MVASILKSFYNSPCIIAGGSIMWSYLCDWLKASFGYPPMWAGIAAGIRDWWLSPLANWLLPKVKLLAHIIPTQWKSKMRKALGKTTPYLKTLVKYASIFVIIFLLLVLFRNFVQSFHPSITIFKNCSFTAIVLI